MLRTRQFLVALLVVLAGCAGYSGGGTTTPSEHSISVSVSNEHDVTYEVRVTAVPSRIEGIEVTYENGSTARYEVRSFDALPRTALRNATAITSGSPGEVSRTFTVGPAEGIGATIDAVPANATVVYFVLPTDGPSRIRGAGVVRCAADAGSTDLALRIHSDGSLHSSLTCTDDS
jgi:hypothetical protein